MKGTKYDQLSYLESYLRHKGEMKTTKDWLASEDIYVFRLNYQMDKEEKTMRKTNREYDNPVWVKGPESVDIPEIQAIVKSEPCTCVK